MSKMDFFCTGSHDVGPGGHVFESAAEGWRAVAWTEGQRTSGRVLFEHHPTLAAAKRAVERWLAGPSKKSRGGNG